MLARECSDTERKTLFTCFRRQRQKRVFKRLRNCIFISHFLISFLPQTTSHIYEFTTYSRETDTRGRVKPPKKIYTTRPEKYSQPAWRNAIVVFVFCCSCCCCCAFPLGNTALTKTNNETRKSRMKGKLQRN